MNNRKEDMEISSHYRQLLRELNEQRQHGILCDACVIVDGKIFKAHKNVLLGSSRYFKTLYCQVKKGSEPHNQTTVTHLDIVTAPGFKAILDFMYSAHLALTSKNVIEVMSAASYLQMTDIVQACHGFIKAALDISIRSEMADELADFEMGAVAAAAGVNILGGGAEGGAAVGGVAAAVMGAVGGAGRAGSIVGMASEALASIMSGRSTSPWLGRRTSPANSSGDSAIASCHEGAGGSTYGCGKEDPEPCPKSHESQEDGSSSQPAWPHDYRPLTVKEEQVSPASSSHHPPRDTGAVPPRGAAQGQGGGEQGGGGGGGAGSAWQPSGSGRRKNRKNKDTVRHITQQAEGNGSSSDHHREKDGRDSSSPLPSMLGVGGWNYNGQDVPDVTEPNSSDSRGERLDFFLKQEEALQAESGGFLGPAGESEEGAGGGGAGSAAASVANLKAALMSKNSLLSLRAEMMGEDNPLFEYLPKGAHSLSRLRSSSNYRSTLRPGATAGAPSSVHNKQGERASSSPPPPPLPPPSLLPPLLLPPSSSPPPPSSSSSSSYCPPTPLHHHHHRPAPPEPWPLEAPGLRIGGPPKPPSDSEEEGPPHMEVDEAPGGGERSALPEENVQEDLKIRGYSMALEGDSRPAETDQMAEGNGLAEREPGSTRPVAAGRVLEAGGGGGGGERPAGRMVPSEPWTSTHDFSCSLCKRLFSSLEHLREHEYHHALSLMAMSLDWRGAQDSYNNNHHHHRPQPPPPPPLCRPSSSGALLEDPAAAARYLCSHCPASFTLKSNADRHEKTIHLKRKLMQCAYCLKHFRDRTDLHRHLSSVHSRERGHSCPACAKAFSTQKNLATHVKVCCQAGGSPAAAGPLLLTGTGGGGGDGLAVEGVGSPDTLWGFRRQIKAESDGGVARVDEDRDFSV